MRQLGQFCAFGLSLARHPLTSQLPPHRLTSHRCTIARWQKARSKGPVSRQLRFDD